MEEEKNFGAIDKIIRSRMLRDYHATWDKLTTKQKYSYEFGKKHGQFQINLGADTREALDIKDAYFRNKINEEEYKAYCMKQNLLDI